MLIVPFIHYASVSICIIYLVYFYLECFKKYDSQIQNSIKVFEKMSNPKRSLQSATRLRNFISRKFKNILDYEPKELSNRFYRRFEFCVAEMVIFNLCLVEYNYKTEKIVLYKTKKIIDTYLKVFTDFDRKNLLESLQSRICMNLIHINNLPSNVVTLMNINNFFIEKYYLSIYPEIITLQKSFSLTFERKSFDYDLKNLKIAIHELISKY